MLLFKRRSEFLKAVPEAGGAVGFQRPPAPSSGPVCQCAWRLRELKDWRGFNIAHCVDLRPLVWRNEWSSNTCFSDHTKNDIRCISLNYYFFLCPVIWTTFHGLCFFLEHGCLPQVSLQYQQKFTKIYVQCTYIWQKCFKYYSAVQIAKQRAKVPLLLYNIILHNTIKHHILHLWDKTLGVFGFGIGTDDWYWCWCTTM